MAAQVLVVEDDPDIRELLRVNLAQAGHQVAGVGDAESAKAAVRAAMPDLMLIDWMLPGLSGIELARHLKREAWSSRVSIIMLTARDADRDKVMALEAGADV
jgi:two-component system phosphate regulon response regulator PhoB